MAARKRRGRRSSRSGAEPTSVEPTPPLTSDQEALEAPPTDPPDDDRWVEEVDEVAERDHPIG